VGQTGLSKSDDALKARDGSGCANPGMDHGETPAAVVELVNRVIAHLALTGVEMARSCALAHQFSITSWKKHSTQCSAISIGSMTREGSMIATRAASNSSSGDAVLMPATGWSAFVRGRLVGFSDRAFTLPCAGCRYSSVPPDAM
jgi:hypothetical protein